MLFEKTRNNGWTLAEAAQHVPDIRRGLTRERLRVWGRLGSKDASPSLIPASALLDLNFSARMAAGDPAIVAGQPAFDLRIFPTLISPSAAEHLNGLSLADAFRRYVIWDCEVSAMEQRILGISVGSWMMFIDGRFPSAEGRPFWPLHANVNTIVFAFMSTHPPTSGGPREEEITTARVLAERVAALIDLLTRGEIEAFGTFAATGVEGAIGRGQWVRKDICLDVRNSDICEKRHTEYVATWTGIRLQLPNRRQSQDHLVAAEFAPREPVKAKKQIQAKNKSKQECSAWLISTMSNPAVAPRSRDALWADARKTWPHTLSRREFDWCRAEALQGLNDQQRYSWGRPGPKPKSSQF